MMRRPKAETATRAAEAAEQSKSLLVMNYEIQSSAPYDTELPSHTAKDYSFGTPNQQGPYYVFLRGL